MWSSNKSKHELVIGSVSFFHWFRWTTFQDCCFGSNAFKKYLFFLEVILHIFPAFSPGKLSLMVHMNWTSTSHLLLGLYELCNAKIPRVLPKLHTYMFPTILSKANANFPSAYHEGRSGSWGITPLLRNLGRKLDWLVIFTPQPLYSRGKNPGYRCCRKIPRFGVDAYEKKKNFFSCRELTGFLGHPAVSDYLSKQY